MNHKAWCLSRVKLDSRVLSTAGGVMAGNNRETKHRVNLNHQKNPWFICSDRSSLAVGERAFRGGVIHHSQANNTVITL